MCWSLQSGQIVLPRGGWDSAGCCALEVETVLVSLAVVIVDLVFLAAVIADLRSTTALQHSLDLIKPLQDPQQKNEVCWRGVRQGKSVHLKAEGGSGGSCPRIVPPIRLNKSATR